MISAGLTYLAGASFNAEGISVLGYPIYLLKFLGTAKLLGGIAVLQERFRTLKEWALRRMYIQFAGCVGFARFFRRWCRENNYTDHHSVLCSDFLLAMEKQGSESGALSGFEFPIRRTGEG